MLTRFSVDTLLATTSLLGPGPLESLAHVRDAQLASLLPARLVDPGSAEGPRAPPRARPNFYYASLDFMPYRDGDREGFQLLDFNGFGAGGLAALPEPVLEALLGEVSRAAEVPAVDAPLLVVPVTHGEKVDATHERILLAQALREGAARRHGRARIAVYPGDIASLPGALVVLGRPPELRAELAAIDGRLHLAGRAVDVLTRDLFCRQVADRFAGQLDADAFLAVNGVHACAAKTAMYARYNAYLAARPSSSPGKPVAFRSAATFAELVAIVDEELARGRSLVLKPYARGGGRGVCFVHAGRPREEAEATLAALRSSVARLAERGREVFPYAVCELLDARPIAAPGHPLAGHRYELRIVVYRVGERLRAFPLACRIAAARFEPGAPTPEMLLNNVARAPEHARGGANPRVLPLSSPRTLELLGLDPARLAALCEAAVDFVAFVAEATP